MSERTEVAPSRSGTLTDELRARDDAALVDLLRTRPDLVTPVPADLGALAARAASAPSVARALDRLDLRALQAVDVLCVLPNPTGEPAVARLLGADPGPALRELRRLALVVGDADAMRLVPAVRSVVGDPAGLGPPVREALVAARPPAARQLLADLARLAVIAIGPVEPTAGRPVDLDPVVRALSDPDALRSLLAGLDPDARAVLDRLTWGPPYGSVPDAARAVTLTTARTPVEELLARGLLVAVDPVTVVLPREVALHLRGGRVHREPASAPPPLATTAHDPARADRTAGGAAFTAVRQVEDLLEAWSVDAPPVLRAGGLGVRELRRTAATLDVEESTAALVVETAYAAGLVGSSSDADAVWLPTPAYDAWRAQEPARRWVTLAAAWLGTTRVAGLVGRRDERDARDRPANALGPALDRPVAPEVRRRVLAELAALPPGHAPAPPALADRLRWRRPRRSGRLVVDLATWTLREAELLGVTGLGALSAPARALLAPSRGDGAAGAAADGARDDGEAAALQALAPLLPEPLDSVLLQADLTAVAPGPLTSELAHELGLAADVESRGGATVYRFSAASVRRALDAGRSAADLHRLLERHSDTPVPQPLSYLVDDLARRYGRIRVGTASAYVRCDDESTLSELVADRRCAQLRLRALAPTVLAAQAEVDVVLDRLRAMGYAPAAEGPEGDVVVRRPDSRRTASRPRPPRLATELPPPRDALLAAAVRALRAADRITDRSAGTGAPARGALPRLGPAATLAALRGAAGSGRALAIGYVNAEGWASQRVIEPIGVEGGYVSAYDQLRDEVVTFALHRITGVAPVDGEPDDVASPGPDRERVPGRGG